MRIQGSPSEEALTEWCSLCNAQPADGQLTMLDTTVDKTVILPACKACVDKIPSEDWIDAKEAPC